jgi:hypothetical protein
VDGVTVLLLADPAKSGHFGLCPSHDCTRQQFERLLNQISSKGKWYNDKEPEAEQRCHSVPPPIPIHSAAQSSGRRSAPPGAPSQQQLPV